MKILHVTNYFRDTHAHVGGAEQACYRTALLARNHGCGIGVVTTKPDRDAQPDMDVHSVPILEDYTPHIARKYLEACKWYSIQYDPLSYRAFRRILKLDDPDVVHFHNCQFLTLSLIKAAKQAGKRTVVSIYDYWHFCPTVMLVDPQKKFCARAHGTWCTDCLPPMFRMFQKALLSIRRPVIDRYLEITDAFHVLSEHSGRVLEGYGIPKERIHVVQLTLPMEYLTQPETDVTVDPDLILFAGWLNERKGIHRLLEAMPHVLKERPSAKLMAIGGKVRFGEEYEKKMDAIIEQGGFRDRVTFTGHMPPSDMKRHIQHAAVIVIPEQYENMSPLLMIEAMSMAKPVVISRVGGVPEFIDHGVTGWLADPLDPRDYAKNILAVLRDPESAARAGSAAREKILTKCDDETIWEKTRRMYEDS